MGTPREIQLYDSHGRVTQFARHQAAHEETGSEIPAARASISNIEVSGLRRTALGNAK
jgi:hypothetical protein